MAKKVSPIVKLSAKNSAKYAAKRAGKRRAHDANLSAEGVCTLEALAKLPRNSSPVRRAAVAL